MMKSWLRRAKKVFFVFQCSLFKSHCVFSLSNCQSLENVLFLKLKTQTKMAKKITLLLILTTLLGILTRFANGNGGKIRVAPGKIILSAW